MIRNTFSFTLYYLSRRGYGCFNFLSTNHAPSQRMVMVYMAKTAQTLLVKNINFDINHTTLLYTVGWDDFLCSNISAKLKPNLQIL